MTLDFSDGDVQITTVGELLDWLDEQPPEHYRPNRLPWDLDAPSRLIYQDEDQYTDLRRRMKARHRGE